MTQMLPPELAGQHPQASPPPSDLAALLGGQGSPDMGGQSDPLASLQDAIHAVAAAMSSLPDAQDTQDAAQALLTLTKIQTRQMASGAQAPR